MEKENEQTCAFFQRSQARILLKQKYVLIMGDSVQRGMYKDLVALLNDGSFMTSEEKRAKGEVIRVSIRPYLGCPEFF